ncbi:MAG: hypothetical protein GY917_11280, partial [Planctomycetaceae bacterium]|nr:hypothetical protein [Planctomycetaceae bacterium]
TTVYAEHVDATITDWDRLQDSDNGEDLLKEEDWWDFWDNSMPGV